MIPTVAIIESEMFLHAGQEKKVIARTNNYSKSDSGKGSLHCGKGCERI